jgi:hypothetical protein
MPLEWVANSAFRFFPARPDEPFGYALHPVDLATNKASAADRREPRDIVHLVTIHENILPPGAVVCAAVGRFPWQYPEEMLSDITRHSRFDAGEFRVPATEHRLAERFINRIQAPPLVLSFWREENPFSPTLQRSADTSATSVHRAACGRRPPKYQAPCWSATTRIRTETTASRNVSQSLAKGKF